MQLREFIRAGSLTTLVAGFLYFFVSTMVWLMIGALAPLIAREFSLSASERGLMVAVPILAGALVRLPLGIAADALGARRTAIAGIIVTIVPLLVGWLFGRSLSEIYLIGILLGVAGGSFAVAFPLVSRSYPAQYQGLAMGIVGAGYLGAAVAKFAGPRLAEWVGWHGALGLAIVPVVLVLILFVRLPEPKTFTSPPQDLRQYLRVLKARDAWWFNLFYMTSFGGFVGLATFLPLFFYDQYGLSPVSAGNIAAACIAAASVVRPFGGWLADQIGGMRLLFALFAVLGGLLLVLAQLPPLNGFVLLVFAIMALLGMANGAVFQLVPQRFSQEIGIVTGVVGATGALGGFFLPTLLGLSKDLSGSYGVGFALFGIMCCLGVALVAYAQKSWNHVRITVPEPTNATD